MDWWQSYFIDSWEEVQHFVKTEAQTQLECDFVQYLMQQNNYHSLLDVPCGAGRVTIEMAKRQQCTQIYGLEYNPNAIAAAKQSARVQGLSSQSIHFLTGDMRNIQLAQTFDMAVCLFNSFGYFSHQQNLQFLSSVSQNLTANGALLLDCHIAETLLPAFTPKEFWKLGSNMVFEERSYDIETATLVGNWTFINQSGQKRHHQTAVKIYTYQALCQMLRTVGFSQFTPFSSFYADPYQFGDDALILLAQKKP